MDTHIYVLMAVPDELTSSMIPRKYEAPWRGAYCCHGHMAVDIIPIYIHACIHTYACAHGSHGRVR